MSEKKLALELLSDVHRVVFGEEPQGDTTPLICVGKIFDALGRAPSSQGLFSQIQEAADILGVSCGTSSAEKVIAPSPRISPRWRKSSDLQSKYNLL